ncbi:hypothetical protein EJ08DRAFT_650028 [Tothia fuscella]|uniref:Malate dehydrogenase n=1 Tax=Tothia fuscella TaxID=1048955 RepID=A0A9P4NRN4_9PEZI|nr:hypothetical protein EJ08DRAFT_650028 [Tothia fuscella]
MRSFTSIPAALLAFTSSVSALALPAILDRFTRDTRLTIAIPLNGLPSPSIISPAVQLKYIALGVGTQNYTCASTPNSASAAPVSLGAKAVLYNAGPFLESRPNMIGRLADKAYGDDRVPSRYDLGILGSHFFNAAGQPTFDLTAVGARLVVRKLNGVTAPPDSCRGKDDDDTGAVDWLQLVDNATGQSFGGLSYVYRVETAGGRAPVTCAKQRGTFEVHYATEYWYYG